MGLSGNLKTISFSDVLQLINMGDKTGTFEIKKGDSKKKIYFKNGKVIYATSSDKDELLENFLLKKDKITRKELEKAKDLQEETGRGFASTLVYLDILPKEEVADLLKTNVQEIIFEIFSWDEAEFEFLEDELPDTENVINALNTMNILMEGTRRIDEWEEIKNKIPADNTVLTISSEEFAQKDEIKLKPEEGKVLSLVDGERSIEEIKEKNTAGELATCRAIYGLLTAGLVRESGKKELKSVKLAEREKILEGLVELFETMLEKIKALFLQKIGEGGRKTFKSVLEKQAKDDELLENIRVDDKGNLDFTNFLELSKNLPEESRFHQVSKSLMNFVEAELDKAEMILGRSIMNNLKEEFREETEDIIEKYESGFIKYGVLKRIKTFLLEE